MVDYFASLGSPDENGSIARGADAQVALGKLDWLITQDHLATLRATYTNSKQENGTFDVDSWGRAPTRSRTTTPGQSAGRSSRRSRTRSSTSSASSSPRRTGRGPTTARTSPGRPGRCPTPRSISGAYRFGEPFFIPVDYFDTRMQFNENLTFIKGPTRSSRGEYNHVNSSQIFRGFQNGRYIFGSTDGFLNYAQNPHYVECSDGSTSQTAPARRAPPSPGRSSCSSSRRASVTSPPRRPVPRTSPRPSRRSSSRTSGTGAQLHHPVRPALGAAERARPDHAAQRGLLHRSSARPSQRPGTRSPPTARSRPTSRCGSPASASPGTPRTTARRSCGAAGSSTRASPACTSRRRARPTAAGARTFPGQLPGSVLTLPIYPNLSRRRGPAHPTTPKSTSSTRTSGTRGPDGSVGVDRAIAEDLAISSSTTTRRASTSPASSSRTTRLSAAPGARAWGPTDRTASCGTHRRQRAGERRGDRQEPYQGVTFGLTKRFSRNYQFQANYTLSWDKSDDDQERDPFTYRYAGTTTSTPSTATPTATSATASTASCSGWRQATSTSTCATRTARRSRSRSTRPAGRPSRSSAPRSDRIRADGSIVERNTGRKDNEYSSLDLRLSRAFRSGRVTVEPILEVFNLFASKNYKQPSYQNLVFNFDGTIASGLGDPRQMQLGVRLLW